MSFSNPVAASSRPRDDAGLCRPQSSQGGELKPADELRAENEALRDRLSRLSESSLRISESLDVNTVLREVVETSGRDFSRAGEAEGKSHLGRAFEGRSRPHVH